MTLKAFLKQTTKTDNNRSTGPDGTHAGASEQLWYEIAKLLTVVNNLPLKLALLKLASRSEEVERVMPTPGKVCRRTQTTS